MLFPSTFKVRDAYPTKLQHRNKKLTIASSQSILYYFTFI
jgi:hypothetical protein